jgi:uncharacterized peroxidase-related enzyme
MLDLTIHTPESAPEAAKETLAGARKAFGFLPNLLGAMAAAPGLVKSYRTVTANLESGSLTPIEQQVVALTVSYSNKCSYCMAAHSGLAKMAGIPDSELEALRSGRELEHPKLEALRLFTWRMVEKRGHVSDAEIKAFLAAGFDPAQVLEVIVGIAMKTMSNYTNHITHIPVDRQVQAFEWEPGAPATVAAGD